jgi:hypothetical protein
MAREHEFVNIHSESFKAMLKAAGGTIGGAALKAGYSGSTISDHCKYGQIPLRLLLAVKGAFPDQDWDSIVRTPKNGTKAHSAEEEELSDALRALLRIEAKVTRLLQLWEGPKA